MPNRLIRRPDREAVRNVNASWSLPLARARRDVLIACVAIGMSLGVSAASAEVVYEYWIGRPTMADYIRHSATNALRSAQQYSQAIGQAEADMANARTSFFKATPANRKAAGDAFGEMLFAKDFMLALPYLSNGYSAHTAAAARLLSLLGGGRPFDGGIRPSADPAFQQWIRSMRNALGARRDDDLVILTQPKLMSALEASQEAYAVYRKDRDLAEHRAWQGLHPLPDQVPGQRPLQRAGESVTLREVLLAHKLQPGMADEIAAADKGGPSLLSCRYGPSFDEQGREDYDEQRFWKDKLPENLDRLVAFDRTAMDRVGYRVVKACPPSEAAASKLSKAPIEITVPQSLKDEVEARRQKQRDEDEARAAAARESREKFAAAAKAREDERRQRSLELAQEKASAVQAERDRQIAEARARREQQVERRNAMMAERVEARRERAAQAAADRERRAASTGRRLADGDRREAQQRYQAALRQCREDARAAGEPSRDVASRCRDEARAVARLP